MPPVTTTTLGSFLNVLQGLRPLFLAKAASTNAKFARHRQMLLQSNFLLLDDHSFIEICKWHNAGAFIPAGAVLAFKESEYHTTFFIECVQNVTISLC